MQPHRFDDQLDRPMVRPHPTINSRFRRRAHLVVLIGLALHAVLGVRPTMAESAPAGAGGMIELVVTGRGGVPSSGVGAVALNVTVTNPTAPSYLTVWPTGAPRPNASNLNYSPGQTVPNMVIAKVGTGGRISLYNYAGTTDVIVDVLGWFPEGTSFTGLTPARLLDTRQTTQPPTTTPPTTTPPTSSPTTTPPVTTPPPFVLQPGDWSGIPAGRYVMEQAQADCYWQRWSDAGDMWVELGVSYQFHPGRAVVDIGGYESLSFTEPCGPLTLLPSTATPGTKITNGVHVVNHHVLQGTYRIVLTEETRGCGWSRLSAFTGGPAAMVDGMYMSDAGEAYVTIFTSDVGFETDCLGTWTRIG